MLEDDPDIEVTYHSESAGGVGLWDEVKSIARDILFAAVMAVLILIFVAQPVKVEGTSMLPRLDNDERIFVNKFRYYFEPIERGDIIVFWYPDDPSKSFIKRVIGLPGETIRMDVGGQLYINSRPVDEPYLSAERNRTPRAIQEQYIKPHYYFVMGDNQGCFK